MSRRKQSNPKPLKRKSEDVLEAVAELHHLPTDLFSLKDPEDEIQEYAVFTKVPLKEGFTLGPYTGHLLEEGQGQDGNDNPVNVLKIKDMRRTNVRLCLTDDTCGWLKLLRLTPNFDSANFSVSLNGPAIWCRVKRDLDLNTELLVSHLVQGEDLKRTSASPSYTPVVPFKHKLNFSSKDDDFRFKKHRTRTRKGRSDSEENDSDDISDCKSPRSLEADANPLLNPCIKCEPRSPSSPPSSPSAARDGLNADMHSSKSNASSSANNTAPYLNGYRYSAAFPCGTNDTPVADERFKCPLCDITFSSSRTLQCHQLYYCSHRSLAVNSTSDTDPEDTSQTVASERSTNVNKSGSPVSNCETSKQSAELPCSRKFTGSSSLYPSEESASKPGNLLATVNNFGGKVGIPRTPRTYRCLYCNYTSDKKASLSRHVRMHGGNSPSSENDPPVSTHPLARYCANCDIQFASFKNYQVHKNFYCSTRHVHKSITSSAPSPSQQQATQQVPATRASSQRASPEKTNVPQESNQYNMMLNQPLYAAISTSPLILVPCSYVAGGGLSPAAGLIPAGNIIIPNTQSANSPDGEQSSHAANVIPTYTVMPSNTVSTASEDTTDDPPSSPQTTERNSKIRRRSTEKATTNTEPKCASPISNDLPKDEVDKPLDLSCKKFTDNKSTTRKHAARSPPDSSSTMPIASIGSSTSSSSSCPDDTASSSISVPPVPVIPGISHVTDSNRGGSTQTAAPSGMILDPRTSSLTPVPVLGGPQILVKQGTSKCKECNIVFYKHENYMVHKSLYCASRLQKDQSISPGTEKIIVDDETEDKDEQGVHESTNSKSPIITHPKTPDPTEQPLEQSNHTPPNQGTIFQFYCMACGIKFTSIDNLTAHQTYYCPKRDIVPQQVSMLTRGEYRCNKCKNVYPTEEALRHHPCVVQRKCPYCDVYCPTLSATQRHLVTHTGVKSFRCSLCGYKGHTLRGMRTHIRIHLDKNNTTPEEAYILCVDEGGSEIGSVNRKAQSRTMSERNHPVQDALHNESIVVGLTPNVTPGLVSSDIVPKKTIPDVVSDQVLSGDITHWCQICGYSSSYKGNVVRHVKLVHKDLMSSQSMASIVNSKPTIGSLEPKQDTTESSNLSDSNAETNDSVKSAVNGTAVMLDTKQKCRADEPSATVLKSESVSPPPVSVTATRCEGVKRSLSVESQQCASNSNASSSSKAGPKYCKACDISFKYLSNFLAHKKFYCTPRLGEPTSSAESGSVQSVL